MSSRWVLSIAFTACSCANGAGAGSDAASCSQLGAQLAALGDSAKPYADIPDDPDLYVRAARVVRAAGERAVKQIEVDALAAMLNDPADPIQQTAARRASIQRGLEVNRARLDALDQQIATPGSPSAADSQRILQAVYWRSVATRATGYQNDCRSGAPHHEDVAAFVGSAGQIDDEHGTLTSELVGHLLDGSTP